MKKLFFMALSFGLAFSLSACSDDSSSNPSSEGKESGDFSEFKKIDEDAQKVLDAAVKDSEYESAKCTEFATQVVAGTNYKFKCSLDDEDIILEVFVDVEGKVELGDEIPSNEEDVDDDGEKSGEFSDFAEIDEDAQKFLDAAIEGTDYASAVCTEFATQVVAGTNYKFKCSDEKGDFILEISEDLDGKIDITYVPGN